MLYAQRVNCNLARFLPGTHLAKFSAALLLFFVAIVIAMPAASQDKNAKRAQEAYESAMKKKQPEERIRLLQKAAGLNPASAELHYALGKEFYQLSRLDSATMRFERVVALDPAFAAKANLPAILPQAYVLLATQRLSSGKLPRALEAALAALRHDSNSASALAIAAVIHYQLAQYSQAIEMGLRLVRLQPSSQHYNNLGAAYESNGDFANAVVCYRQALQMDAALAEAQRNLNRAQTRLDELQAASMPSPEENAVSPKGKRKTQKSSPAADRNKVAPVVSSRPQRARADSSQSKLPLRRKKYPSSRLVVGGPRTIEHPLALVVSPVTSPTKTIAETNFAQSTLRSLIWIGLVLGALAAVGVAVRFGIAQRLQGIITALRASLRTGPKVRKSGPGFVARRAGHLVLFLQRVLVVTAGALSRNAWEWSRRLKAWGQASVIRAVHSFKSILGIMSTLATGLVARVRAMRPPAEDESDFDVTLNGASTIHKAEGSQPSTHLAEPGRNGEHEPKGIGLQTEVIFTEMIVAAPEALESEPEIADNAVVESAKAPESTEPGHKPSVDESGQFVFYSQNEADRSTEFSLLKEMGMEDIFSEPTVKEDTHQTSSSGKVHAISHEAGNVGPAEKAAVIKAIDIKGISIAQEIAAAAETPRMDELFVVAPLGAGRAEKGKSSDYPQSLPNPPDRTPEGITTSLLELSERAVADVVAPNSPAVALQPAAKQRINRYIISKEISRGTTGRIYQAWDPKLDRVVVLKTMHYGFSASESEIAALKERIYREARAVAKLSHPNIVIVYDVDDEPGFSYIVMEHLEGSDLKQALEHEHRIPCGRALEIVSQVCSAMEYAHRSGVFHRDVKPSNIMLLENDEVKVMDFGIAKINNYFTLTQTGRVLGTPSYMAPEQIEGHATDGRADLFSVGVVLYELLAGRRPFVADSIAALAYQIVHKPHIPPSLENLEIPLEMDQILNRALAKNPAERFQTAEEFRAALMEVKGKIV